MKMIALVALVVPLPAIAAWNVTEAASKLDRRSKVVTAAVDAEEASTGSGGSLPARLIIRCNEKITELAVVFARPVASSEVSVQYRLGNSPPTSATWTQSEDNRAYGLWRGKAPIEMATRIASADELYIRGQSRVFGSSEAAFKLTGATEAIKRVREACGW